MRNAGGARSPAGRGGLWLENQVLLSREEGGTWRGGQLVRETRQRVPQRHADDSHLGNPAAREALERLTHLWCGFEERYWRDGGRYLFGLLCQGLPEARNRGRERPIPDINSRNANARGFAARRGALRSPLCCSSLATSPVHPV